MSDRRWHSVSGRSLAQGDLLPDCLLPVFVAPAASQSSDDSQEVSVLTARLTPTSSEFCACGQACIEMTRGMFQLLREHNAVLFATSAYPKTARRCILSTCRIH